MFKLDLKLVKRLLTTVRHHRQSPLNFRDKHQTTLVSKVLIYVGMCCIITSCAHIHHQKLPPLVIVPDNSNAKVAAPFSSIDIKGNLDVTLHTQSVVPKVILHGDPRDLLYAVWSVYQGVLHIDVGKGYPKYGPISADISTPNLRSFKYHGSGTIAGQHLQSKALDLLIRNNGKTMLEGHIALYNVVLSGNGVVIVRGVQSRATRLKLSGGVRVQLMGFANVTSLHMKGHSWLSLYWLKSPSLLIRARDEANVQLAGVVPYMDVELWDGARFNGRYLRVKTAFVKTHGHSEADIAVLDNQHTLATDKSNIYFYDLPTYEADFMAFAGSVLDMRPWEFSYRKEPTRYNH